MIVRVFVDVGVCFGDVGVCFGDVSGLVRFGVVLFHDVLFVVTFSGINLLCILSILVVRFFTDT